MNPKFWCETVVIPMYCWWIPNHLSELILADDDGESVHQFLVIHRQIIDNSTSPSIVDKISSFLLTPSLFSNTVLFMVKSKKQGSAWQILHHHWPIPIYIYIYIERYDNNSNNSVHNKKKYWLVVEPTPLKKWWSSSVGIIVPNWMEQ